MKLTTILIISSILLSLEFVYSRTYVLHENVTATVFWVGEPADGDNGYISNEPSAWDEKWKSHYGGVDDPENRKGYYPAKFKPKLNPFYFALPYNDLDDNGDRKPNAMEVVPWAYDKEWVDGDSMCKDRWIAVTLGSTTCYSQWQDVGPFNEDDELYVFSSDPFAIPRNPINDHAGLDLSPATRDCIGMEDNSKVTWRFVDDADVPEGPWTAIVSSGLSHQAGILQIVIATLLLLFVRI